MSGLGRYYEIRLAFKGQPDPQTGYLISIQRIDALVRDHLVPIIARQVSTDPCVDPGTLMPSFWETISRLTDIELNAMLWQLTPYHSVEMTQSAQSSNAVLVRQRYDFAAAHRLHTPELNDQQNANFFGKCNNLNGHGHNYQIEPCIRIPVDLLKSKNYQIEIQHTVNTVLLDQLDHKFLNTDCPWFNQSLGGVIPSIEHITRICYEQLAPAIAQIAPGIKLVSMTAWETEKTSSIYPADAH